jgi:hypothetical protein
MSVWRWIPFARPDSAPPIKRPPSDLNDASISISRPQRGLAKAFFREQVRYRRLWEKLVSIARLEAIIHCAHVVPCRGATRDITDIAIPSDSAFCGTGTYFELDVERNQLPDEAILHVHTLIALEGRLGRLSTFIALV